MDPLPWPALGFELCHAKICLRLCGAFAQAASHVGMDLFNYESDDGRSLRRALGYVAPYATLTAAQHWPYEEETPFDRGKFFQILRVACVLMLHTNVHVSIPQVALCVQWA